MLGSTHDLFVLAFDPDKGVTHLMFLKILKAHATSIWKRQDIPVRLMTTSHFETMTHA